VARNECVQSTVRECKQVPKEVTNYRTEQECKTVNDKQCKQVSRQKCY